jgi:hypothetical protein
MVYNTGVIRLVISTTLLGCLALTQAGPSVPQVAPVPYETPEAYEVYAAILPSEWSWKDAKAKRLVIRASTIHYNMCLEPDADSAKLIGSAITDYIQQNQHPWLLQPRLTIEKPYVLLSPEQIESTFRRSPEGWEAFTQMYPDSGGIIEFSAVGFNSNKTVAVVYSGHSCGASAVEEDSRFFKVRTGNGSHSRGREVNACGFLECSLSLPNIFS